MRPRLSTPARIGLVVVSRRNQNWPAGRRQFFARLLALARHKNVLGEVRLHQITAVQALHLAPGRQADFDVEVFALANQRRQIARDDDDRDIRRLENFARVRDAAAFHVVDHHLPH